MKNHILLKPGLRRPGFPPVLLLRCLILQLMYRLSDRDMLFMGFVGLRMEDSVLSKFREGIEGAGRDRVW
ncbi:MAG: transposase [Candidatus Hydrothermia bacterium]